MLLLVHFYLIHLQSYVGLSFITMIKGGIMMFHNFLEWMKIKNKSLHPPRTVTNL